MNRRYLDIPNTLLVQCLACRRRLPYTAAALEAHERRCKVTSVPSLDLPTSAFALPLAKSR